MPDWLFWMLAAGYFLTWLLIPWVLLRPNDNTSSSVAWIFSIIFIPYLGALLCVLFSQSRWEVHRDEKRTAAVQINKRVPQWRDKYVATAEDLGRWSPLARLGANLTGAEATRGNQVEILENTQVSLERIAALIEEAQHWIHVEFYIWRSDEVGRRIRDLLIEKARQGVEVRFLYDGFGSMLLSRGFLKPLKKAGVHIAPFTPGLELKRLVAFNLRNHRKAVIVDGRAAITGGMNIGQEYVSHTPAYGHLSDVMVCFRGPASLQLQQMFAQDWFYATGEALTGHEYYPAPPHEGDTPSQVVADGPDNDVDTLYCLLVGALGIAQEKVCVATPYFVPPDGLTVALETAARRGVKVQLIIARKGNFSITLKAGRSYYERLLAAGVEIYEFRDGFFHGKTLSVDGSWALIGSANWDYRGCFINFEVALSCFDRAVAEELDRLFEGFLESCERIEPERWRKRSKVTRLQEQFWRLFSPVL